MEFISIHTAVWCPPVYTSCHSYPYFLPLTRYNTNAFPYPAITVSAPQRRPVVMDDAAMLQLEKEVAMINDLIGLKAEGAELEQDRDRDRVADPREREQDIGKSTGYKRVAVYMFVKRLAI